MANTVVSTPASLEALFDRPTIEDFRQPIDFVAFVVYVFERAGYAVKDVGAQYWPGVFELYAGGEIKGRPSAYAWAKQSPKLYLGEGDVAIFMGKLDLNSAGTGSRYIVTATGFTEGAYKAAAGKPHLHLIDGEHLARYIIYVRGSRHQLAHGHVIPPDSLFHTATRRKPSDTKVLAIANNKGGVGKTTTALNLALGLAEKDKNVLLVDLDAQANLTQSVLKGVAVDPPHIADYFIRGYALSGLMRETQFPRVWLIPSHSDLRLTHIDIADWPRVEAQFLADLHDPAIRPPRQSGAQFDWVVLDTPPAMSLHTRVGLAAAHYVLAPTIPSAFAEPGLDHLFDTMGALRALTGDGVSMLGCLVTQWQDNAIKRDALKYMKDTHLAPRGTRILATKIPYDQNLDKLEWKAQNGLISGIWRRPGAGVTQYRELVQEVLEHVGNG